jgi:outer membrane protein OmpA-like peptidoglycan-associated protein
MNSRIRSSLVVAVALAALPTALSAQGILSRAKKAAKERLSHDTPAQVAQPASGAAAQSAAPAGSSPSTAASSAPGTGVWLNYDFVPGDRVLFYDDFADDKVGDLPSHENVTNGNVTVVEVNGKKYLHTVTGATMLITLPEVLPQRFTIEATVHRTGGNGSGLHIKVGDGFQEVDLRCDQGSGSIDGEDADRNGKSSGQDTKGIGENDFETCRYMVDGGYVKAYINDQRVGQLNGLAIHRLNKIEVDVPNANDNGTLLTDIRVAAGGKPLYDALAESGRVSTHGILFATGSATIEGESTPTLKEIGDMLKAHPELKLTIEGHTDDVGDGASNQTLSDRRAAAVKAFLVSTYGVDASRLQTKGYGASKPVAANTSPEGRQQNRRVELVKM